MPTTDRWLAVDDTISSINYIGDSWFADVGSQDATDNGPPFLSTLHGTNTTASLTFNFTGSAVVIMGTNLIRNDSGVIDPQWSCYVDGVSIYSVPPLQYPENNWAFCSSYSLTDGPHTITVNAKVARNQTFWFDRIDYLPSKSVSLANKTILLTSADPAIQYGTGWSAYAALGNWTQTHGASFVLNFYGTSLSWYGDITSELSGNSTTATWAIDDNPGQTFALKGHGANATTAYNQKFFETAVYPFGPHKLTVTYNGDSSKTPLVLRQIVLQNDTAATSKSGISTHTTSNHIPAIVGGIIGGVAFLLVLLVLFVLYRRRRRQQSEKEMEIIVEPLVDYAPLAGPQVDHPSRLPEKLSEGRPNFLLSPHFPGHASPGLTGLSSVTDPIRSLTTGDEQHSRGPSDSRVSDSTSQIAGPSSSVVHEDSGARSPVVMPVPGSDIPPAYTPD